LDVVSMAIFSISTLRLFGSRSVNRKSGCAHQVFYRNGLRVFLECAAAAGIIVDVASASRIQYLAFRLDAAARANASLHEQLIRPRRPPVAPQIFCRTAHRSESPGGGGRRHSYRPRHRASARGTRRWRSAVFSSKAPGNAR